MSKHTSPYVGNSARGQRDYVRQYGDDRRVDKHKAIANGRLEKGRKRKHFELEASTSDQSTKKQKQEPSNKRKREEDIADGEDGETHPPAAKKLVTNDDRIQMLPISRRLNIILTDLEDDVEMCRLHNLRIADFPCLYSKEFIKSFGRRRMMSHSEQPNGEVKLWLVKETSGAKWFDSLRKCIPQMVDCTCGKCPGRVPKPLLDGKVEQEARARQEEKAKYEDKSKTKKGSVPGAAGSEKAVGPAKTKIGFWGMPIKAPKIKKVLEPVRNGDQPFKRKLSHKDPHKSLRRKASSATLESLLQEPNGPSPPKTLFTKPTTPLTIKDNRLFRRLPEDRPQSDPEIRENVAGIECKVSMSDSEVNEFCCYSNSIMQGLLTILNVEQLNSAVDRHSLPELGEYTHDTSDLLGTSSKDVKNRLKDLKEEVKSGRHTFDLAAEIVDFLDMLLKCRMPTTSFRLRQILAKDVSEFDGKTQQDAAEFLEYILDTLHANLVKEDADEGANDDVANGGSIHPESNSSKNHIDLNGDIQSCEYFASRRQHDATYSFENLFNKSLEPEYVQAFECEGCSTKCQESCTDKECTQCVKVRHDHAKKTYRTEKQPNKLICRINRYFVSKEKSKSAARVTLPFDGFSWTREQDGKQTRSDYELVMVNKHKGSEPTEGHYVSYVKKKGEWIRCDDANVKGFSTKKVAEDAIQSRRDGDAYLLFFRRVQQLEDVKRDEEHGDGGKHGHSGATDDDKGNRGRARP